MAHNFVQENVLTQKFYTDNRKWFMRRLSGAESRLTFHCFLLDADVNCGKQYDGKQSHLSMPRPCLRGKYLTVMHHRLPYENPE